MNSAMEEWKTRCEKKLKLLIEKYKSNDAARMSLIALAARLQHANINNLSSVLMDMHRIADSYAPEVRELIPGEEDVIRFFSIGGSSKPSFESCKESWVTEQDPEAWILDVWDCHGTLKKYRWGAGYGSKPSLDCEWRDIGYFSIPLKKGSELHSEEIEVIVDVLFQVLYSNHGAINISGWYPVSSEAMDDIRAILKDRLFEEG